jgi:hypothetical protein
MKVKTNLSIGNNIDKTALQGKSSRHHWISKKKKKKKNQLKTKQKQNKKTLVSKIYKTSEDLNV